MSFQGFPTLAKSSTTLQRRMQASRKMQFETLEDRRVLAASLGWDGAGQGSADLTYFIRNTPSSLNAQQVSEAIKTALNVWSSVVDVDFTQASRAGLQRSIDISFQRVDGTGSTLAYAYFPSSSSRGSTLAGDVVFDSSERWEIGNGQGNQAFDLVSVAVHELGHALGLDHLSDQASIMYESISASETFTGLSQSDVTAIRKIYATRTTIVSSTTTESTSTSTTNSSTTSNTSGTTTSTGTTGTGTTTNTTNSSGSNRVDTRWLGMPLSLLSTINQTKMDEVFQRLDSNDDNAITSDEISVRLRNFFTKQGTDADANGSISGDELKATVQALQKSLFDRIDANDDGSLAASEVNAKVWETLGRADTDANSLVSFDEFLAFQEKSMFERYDSDGDGEITDSEVSESIWSRLSPRDTDASGTISATEFQQRNRRGNRGSRECESTESNQSSVRAVAVTQNASMFQINARSIRRR